MLDIDNAGDHSGPYAFDDREVSMRRHDAPKPETGSRQQLLELHPRALSAAWRKHQHLEIQELAEVRAVTVRDDRVDDKHLPAGLHGAVTVSQDLSCPIVIPVMNDVLHHVGVASAWNRGKEVTAHELAAAGHACALE